MFVSSNNFLISSVPGPFKHKAFNPFAVVTSSHLALTAVLLFVHYPAS